MVSEEPRVRHSRAGRSVPSPQGSQGSEAIPHRTGIERRCLYSRQPCAHCNRERMDVGAVNEPSLPKSNSVKHVKGIRTCHPKICHWGIRVVFS